MVEEPLRATGFSINPSSPKNRDLHGTQRIQVPRTGQDLRIKGQLAGNRACLTPSSNITGSNKRQIGDDDKSITRACDYCFNTKYKAADGIQISTPFTPKAHARPTETETSSPQCLSGSQLDNPLLEVEERLNACEGCGVVYYCDRICQRKAWRQHHKRECAILKAGRAKVLKERAEDYGDDTESEEGTDDEDTEEEDVEEEAEEQEVYFNVFDNRVRMTIRFLVLSEEGQSRGVEDGPFDHFSWNVRERQLPPPAEHRYHHIATLVKELTNTSFTFDEIYGWARMLDESRRKLEIPILKGPNQPPHIGSMVSSGWFVDPVLSMVQHSCEPNARAVVEDGRVWALALKDIPVNGEVTFDYVPNDWAYDYSVRVSTMNDDWGIDCCCHICQKGKSRTPGAEWPSFGNLIIEASRHTMDEPSCGAKIIASVDLWIPRLEQLGYGPGGEYFPFYRRLWWIRLAQRYGEKLYRETLHACLMLYVQIEPGHVGYEGRIDSLYVLCDLLDPKACDHRVKDEGWTGMPADIRCEFPGLHYCLRERYHRMVRRCFGDSADITKYEEEVYRRHLEQTEEKEGWRRRLTQDGIYNLRENMQEGLNELLNWVGLGVIIDLSVSDELLGWRA
ncbi:hypothetical protein DL98DRAFT_629826 [Cadophora sp. DSE1049]|nr:hypothetical protein DL98DRAFT_629826 [Cadophora sp. DSE1049]